MYRLATLLSLASVSASAPIAHAAPSLRVRAKVHIELQTERVGDGVRLHGTLRDDLAAPLSGRELQLRVQAVPATARPQLRSLHTDVSGRFSTLLSAREPAERALVTFEGDDYYERAETSQVIDVERSELSLRFAEPDDWRIPLDQKATRIELHADSELGGADLPIVVQDELGRPIAQGTTDRSGVLILEISNQWLGDVGLGEFNASCEGDATRGAARVTQPVLRTRKTELGLRVQSDAKTQTLHVALRLSSATGGLAQRAVGVFVDGTHLITLLTDQRGEATRDFALASTNIRAGSHRASARFESDTPGWIASQSVRVSFAIVRTDRRRAAQRGCSRQCWLRWHLCSGRCERTRGIEDRQADLPSRFAQRVRFGAADHAAIPRCTSWMVASRTWKVGRRSWRHWRSQTVPLARWSCTRTPVRASRPLPLPAWGLVPGSSSRCRLRGRLVRRKGCPTPARPLAS